MRRIAVEFRQHVIEAFLAAGQQEPLQDRRSDPAGFFAELLFLQDPAGQPHRPLGSGCQQGTDRSGIVMRAVVGGEDRFECLQALQLFLVAMMEQDQGGPILDAGFRVGKPSPGRGDGVRRVHLVAKTGDARIRLRIGKIAHPLYEHGQRTLQSPGNGLAGRGREILPRSRLAEGLDKEFLASLALMFAAPLQDRIKVLPLARCIHRGEGFKLRQIASGNLVYDGGHRPIHAVQVSARMKVAPVTVG